MKTLLTLCLAACSTLALRAQDTTMVLFSVDMNDVDTFDRAQDLLRVAGDFQSWTPMAADSSNVLTDPDSNGVFSVVMAVAPGEILFKYVINNWNGSGERTSNEFAEQGTDYGACSTGDTDGNANRSETIPSTDTTFALPTYVYNTCDVSERSVVADTATADTSSSVRALPALAGVSVMPNPMTERATVSLPALDGETFVVRVLGADGRVALAPLTTTATSLELAGADLPRGLYLVDVTATAAGRRAVLRLLVE